MIQCCFSNVAVKCKLFINSMFGEPFADRSKIVCAVRKCFYPRIAYVCGHLRIDLIVDARSEKTLHPIFYQAFSSPLIFEVCAEFIIDLFCKKGTIPSDGIVFTRTILCERRTVNEKQRNY